ncbi:hypothetical protein SDC9_40115 [bioreactor metagenome]|uniref:Uncharacterized protein n=1 Tax=bioreactor metagenome TaxID=1076179 RepID=A0A644VRR7_9ZZZZ
MMPFAQDRGGEDQQHREGEQRKAAPETEDAVENRGARRVRPGNRGDECHGSANLVNLGSSIGKSFFNAADGDGEKRQIYGRGAAAARLAGRAERC